MAVKSNAAHVPYRSSKLTYLLQNAIGVSSKTLLIANVAPTFASAGETLCTLRFAKSIAECGSLTGATNAKAKIQASNENSDELSLSDDE